MKQPTAHPGIPVRILHSADEAAVLLGVSPRFVWKLIRSGTLPAVRLGGRTLIARATLEGFTTQPDNGRSQAGAEVDRVKVESGRSESSD